MNRRNRWTLPILLILFAALAGACGGGAEDLDAELTRILSETDMGPEQKIQQLEAFLEKDPPPELASEARFTVGWIYAETLHQYDEARRSFTELVEEHPDSRWAPDARWMIENMEKDPSELLPELQREVSPPGEALRDTGGGLPPL
ncbi:MAG: hypothetical protein R6W82_04880 [bacterium]